MKAKRLLLQALMALGGALCLAPMVWQFFMMTRIRAAAAVMQRELRAHDSSAMSHYMSNVAVLYGGGWLLGLLGVSLFLLAFFALRRMPRPVETPPPLPPTLG